MLATASAQVCVPLGHSNLYFPFASALRSLQYPEHYCRTPITEHPRYEINDAAFNDRD